VVEFIVFFFVSLRVHSWLNYFFTTNLKFFLSLQSVGRDALSPAPASSKQGVSSVAKFQSNATGASPQNLKKVKIFQLSLILNS